MSSQLYFNNEPISTGVALPKCAHTHETPHNTMITTKSTTVPMMSQKTVATDTAAAPSSKPCIDSLRYVNLAECDREEFAAFYLENQYANPNFRALGASNDDIRTYGRSIYDISALPPCLGMVCVTDTGKVLACSLAVSSDHLQHLDEEKLGKVAAHAALVKHFAKQMLDAWHLAGKETLLHHIYGGCLESYRGTGVYGRVSEASTVLVAQHRCPWAWSYSTNAAVMLKTSLGKRGHSTEVADAFANSWLLPTLFERSLPTLLNSPEWMLRSVLKGLITFGYMPANPVIVTKLRSFTYKGAHPFAGDQVCVCTLYKIVPPPVKAKL